MPVEQIIDAARNTSFIDVLATFFSILQYPAVTLLTAMLLEIVLPINATWRISNLSTLFEKMANKVNRKENSVGQTVFSSIFLPFLLLTVAVSIILLLRFTIDFDVIISLIVLPLLLESKPILRTTLSVKRALDTNNKEHARSYLQKVMLRQCDKLSVMGINKALSEAVAMSLFINWFAILVWFMLLDLEGAILMQMVAVMNRSFSLKQEKYALFGIFIHKLESLLLMPCAICLFLTMLLSTSALRIIRNVQFHISSYKNFISAFVLDLLGSYANVSLGGPRYYNNILYRIEKLGGSNDPTVKTPLKIYNKIRFCGILFVCICVVVKIYLYSAHV
ncbi:MAG: hypothetical protein GX278_00975 [Aeromonadales bacterium]|nr:hypothetical protein [Aeromonadales bacterium]